jgi:hypothetical protein
MRISETTILSLLSKYALARHLNVDLRQKSIEALRKMFNRYYRQYFDWDDVSKEWVNNDPDVMLERDIAMDIGAGQNNV